MIRQLAVLRPALLAEVGDRTAPPFGSAAGRGHAPAVDSTALDSAAELRAAFDRTFAAPVPVAVPYVDAIAIHAGGGRCAFGQGEIAALRTDLHITPVASTVTGMLGVTSFRGALVAVWDLGLLLHGAPVTGLRWCAVLRDESSAVAFDRMDGRARVPAPLARMVELDGAMYPVFQLAGAVAGARTHAKPGARTKLDLQRKSP